MRALDAGSWFSTRFAGNPRAHPAEFLDVLDASGSRAIVEFKGAWDAAAVTTAMAEISARDLERRIAISSFDARTLAFVAVASEIVPRLLILKHIPDDVVAAAGEAGVRGIVVERKALLKRPEVVGQLHRADVRVVVYTLNRDSQWDAVTALGVDGILTDDPGTLSQWQRAAAGRKSPSTGGEPLGRRAVHDRAEDDRPRRQRGDFRGNAVPARHRLGVDRMGCFAPARIPQASSPALGMIRPGCR